MTVTAAPAPVARKRIEIRVVLAFFAIYVIWGSTFLAIRTAVLLAPPWFLAGIRFFTAGVILYFFARLRGAERPSLRQWRSLAVIGSLMFFATYSALFWAEQYVSSGITSVLESPLPLFVVLFEVFVFRQQKFRWRVSLAVTVGFAGVALMLLRNGHPGVAVLPCFVILVGSASWSLGSVLTKSLELPQSRAVAAGAEMMLGGSLLLILSAVSGELHPFPRLPAKVAFSLAYLVIAGSLICFTAFVWLLGRVAASKVASHAYVNPIVALALGHFFASEQVNLRTLLGAGLVIGSVFLTLKEE